ncbi:Radical SAM domain protein [Gloeothece citriformis PCC 7424]|uniref:Radical SAM domain protein n=1 Tax=Gloeothece citriformis (strain PCC 7424) TaxID=65393 RepID=B7K6S1_GLOC7|nr:radical SAM protein [Gloeothece citriformis]ACK72620.1 Radical SAM domain protein [Gloeothece citriformis PCC 7424]
MSNDKPLKSQSKQLFCSKPFEWFEITQLNGRGGTYLCCPSWLNKSVGNLQQQSVDEIWNGEQAQKIRRSILDGSFKYCDSSRCAFLQTQSGPVQKIEDVTDENLKTIINENLSVLPYGPKKIICTYDQSCNLSCPSCRDKVIVEIEAEQEILKIQEKLENEALKNAEYLHITGSGDPFGSPYFRKWLQTMNREEMPNLQEIYLQTNGQLWTPRMWNTIAENIRELIISADIGIDAATPETYGINRRGGNFETLLKNLEFISSLRQNGLLRFLKISMVVQANNFREMPDFVKLGHCFNADVIYFGQLVNWGTFSNEEFHRRAVHLPTHPLHFEFAQLLKDEVFEHPNVILGNLTEVKKHSQESLSQKVLKKTQNLLGQLIHK